MYHLWLRIALLLYGLASLAVLPAVLYDRREWRRIAVPAAAGGALFQFVALAEMLHAAHRWLPSAAHEVQSSIALLLAVLLFVLYARLRSLSPGVLLLPFIFLLTLLPAVGPDHRLFPTPTVRSGWVVVHIILLLTAYGALIVSMCASMLSLWQEQRLKRKALSGRLPPLATLDRVSYRALLIGFPCMTAGLLVGSVLAQESFGAGYFLDPKVLLSFALWGLYVALLFLRRTTGLRGRRAVYLSAFIVMVVLTVWMANQFSAVHRFAAP
jgi:ABC-type uncharacterized transport system permease subunit